MRYSGQFLFSTPSPVKHSDCLEPVCGPNLAYHICFCKSSFNGTQPGPLLKYCVWLLLHYKGTTEWLLQRPYGPQNLKYLLSGTLQKVYQPLA